MDIPPSIHSFPRRASTQLVAVVALLTLLASACGSSSPESEAASAPIDAGETTEVASEAESTTVPTTTVAPATTAAPASAVAPTTTAAPTTTTAPTTTVAEPVVAFNGRAIPATVTNATDAAALYIDVQRGLLTDGQSNEVYADLGHTEQVLIRSLMRNQEWIEPFRAELPDDLLVIADHHINARRELSTLHSGWTPTDNIPAWTIIEPAPLEDLISFYKSASEQTGIDWEILAGINLVETGMGRIDGVSSAGAQGPMQFLPTTWPEVSQGGDVTDPSDAIHGAARYLVQRGGLEDISAGLWGYNNSDHYGNAVQSYAELIRLDERNLRGFYNWEIYIGSAEGTLWLPVGYSSDEVGSAAAYIAENPWANTLTE